MRTPENLKEWEELRDRLAYLIQGLKGVKKNDSDFGIKGIPAKVVIPAIQTRRSTMTFEEFIYLCQETLREIEETIQRYRGLS